MTVSQIYEGWPGEISGGDSYLCLDCEGIFHTTDEDSEPEYCPYCGEGPGE